MNQPIWRLVVFPPGSQSHCNCEHLNTAILANGRVYQAFLSVFKTMSNVHIRQQKNVDNIYCHLNSTSYLATEIWNASNKVASLSAAGSVLSHCSTVVKTFLSLSYNQSLSLSSSLSLSLSSSPSLSLSLCLSFHRLCLPPSLQLDRRYQTAAGRLKASGSLSGQKIHNYAELGTLFAQVCNSGCEHLTTFAAHYSSFTTLHNYAQVHIVQKPERCSNRAKFPTDSAVVGTAATLG